MTRSDPFRGADQRVDAIIAGVNKAGTTSLFASLSNHADITPSAIKETDHFLPPRWGQPIEPASVYEGYFPRDAGVRLEASPSYFYGGRAVANAIANELPNPQILLLLREPVARAVSFFRYQKVRLRIPVELPLQEYLEHADALDVAADRDPENERYFAVPGSSYADYLPDWLEVMGRERIWIAGFETMTSDPSLVLADAATHLGLGADRFTTADLQSENVTTGYRSRGLQRVALDCQRPPRARAAPLSDREASRTLDLLPDQRSLRRGADPGARHGRPSGALRGTERTAQGTAHRSRLRPSLLARRVAGATRRVRASSWRYSRAMFANFT